MSDKELIIKSLEKVNHRLRTNHLLRELGFGLSIFLMVPVLFKAWDLFSPFRGRTVAIVLVLWLIGMVAYIVWKLSGKTALSHTAAAIDEYWLVGSPIRATALAVIALAMAYLGFRLLRSGPPKNSFPTT